MPDQFTNVERSSKT